MPHPSADTRSDTHRPAPVTHSRRVIGITTLLTLITLSTVPVFGAEKAAEATPRLFDWLAMGGPVMILIALCSIAGLTLAVERIISLRLSKNIPHTLPDALKQTFDFHGVQGALEMCRSKKSGLSRVIHAALLRFETGDRREMELVAQEEAGRLAFDLKRNIRLIGIFSQISPLLGLGGTVLGMIGAFQKFSLGQSAEIGGDISEALITTLAGLAVAIVLFLFYHWLKNRADMIVRQIEDIATTFILDIADRHGGRHAVIVSEDIEAEIPTKEFPAVDADGDADNLLLNELDEHAETAFVTPAEPNAAVSDTPVDRREHDTNSGVPS